MRARCNVLISGGTGSGKTTTLNALTEFIGDGERIVTVEDAAELRLRHAHVVRLEARPASLEGRGEVTVRRLVRNALRMRPDRIVVGEVRGAEALDMLSAMSSGHDGSLSTVHAGSPEEALRRVETLALMAGLGPAARGDPRAGRGRAGSRRPPGADVRRHAPRRRRQRGRARRGRRGDARALRAARRAADLARAARRRPRRAAGGGTAAGRGPRERRRAARRPGRRLRAARGLGGDRRGRARSALLQSLRRWCAPVLDVLRAGREPTSPERRRLRRARHAVAARRGLAPGRRRGPGSRSAATAPWAARAVVRARRRRRAAAVAAGAPAIARALADALAGGHSVRGALTAAARDGAIAGPAGEELRRVGRRARARRAHRGRAARRSRGAPAAAPLDTLVAAVLLQRDAGGDLAALLRDLAAALEERGRVVADARSATAQARFTALLVAALPAAGLALGELAAAGLRPRRSPPSR